jgi:cold shock CspA family protein
VRYQGRITTWKDDKGFGFITPNGSGAQVFVHISSFSNRQRRPEGNEIVTYELKVDGKGRAQANSVAFVGERPTPSAPPGRSNIPPIFAVCFLVLVVVAVFAGRLPIAALAL